MFALQVAGRPDDLASVPWQVPAVATTVLPVLVGLQLPLWFLFALGLHSATDFPAFYGAGRLLRQGLATELFAPGVLYPPFIHPAYEAILFVPFSFFGLQVAHAVWTIANIGLIVLTYQFVRPHLASLAEVRRWLPAVLLFSYLPILYVIMQGQDSLVLLALYAGAFDAMKRGKIFLAGVLVGFGVFRFQILLPLLVLFAIWRSWRFVRGALASAAGCALLSVAITGLHAHTVDYLRLLAGISAKDPVLNMVSLRGLFLGLGVSSPTSSILGTSLPLAAAAFFGLKATTERRFLYSVLAASIASYHFFLHDLSIAIIPLLLLLGQFVEAGNWPFAAVAVGAIALPEVLAFFGAPIWLNCFGLIVAVVFLFLNSRGKEENQKMTKRLAVRVLEVVNDESGQGLVEYLLILALVAFAATAGMNSLANGLNSAFASVGKLLGQYI